VYVLREQRPGTRRPSGLVKSLHNDNVVLTQVCCYRCTATTATPVTTSKFYEDVDGVLDEGEGRPRSFTSVSCTTISSTSSASDTIVTAASSGGRPWQAARNGNDDEDGGGLTLTIPVDGEAVDRALVRLPPAQEIHFSDFVRW